jgi:hypothetical protein
MLAVLHSLGMFIVDLFKSRRRLEAENLFLRHQLSIALRHAPPRLRLRGSDRALLVWMATALAEPARCHAGGSAGDHSSLASCGLQGVLALEIAKEGLASTGSLKNGRGYMSF